MSKRRYLFLLGWLFPLLLLAEVLQPVRVDRLPSLRVVQRIDVQQQMRGYEIRSAKGELLGYSQNGCFATDTLHPAMQDWLTYVNQSAAQGIAMAPARATGKAVKPLLKTTWSQGSPYNDACPFYSGSERGATGCVATAMAQIMKYWRWPLQGIGSRSYTTSTYRKSVSVNFKTTYDWDNMLDSYKGSYTSTQGDAIAKLMYHCGASCYMDYGESSGASITDAYTAMSAFFKYSTDIDLLMRRNFTYQQWDSIVRAELDAGRPILHSGYTTNLEGHAFVCDGYDASGYFHFNWGWEGAGDGYYLLTNLTPTAQGIGGSSNGEGFNTAEHILIRIYPDTCTSILPAGSFMVCDKIKASTSQRAVTLSTTSLYTTSYKALDVTLGFALYDMSGQRLVMMDSAQKQLGQWGRSESYTASKYTIPSSIPNGDYYVRLDYRHNGTVANSGWHSATNENGATTQLKIHVGTNNVTTQQLADTARLQIVSLGPTCSVYQKYRTQFQLRLKNDSPVEFFDPLNLCIRNNKTGEITNYDTHITLIPADSTIELNFVELISQDSGSYRVGLTVPVMNSYEYYQYNQYQTLWGEDFQIQQRSGSVVLPTVVSINIENGTRVHRDSSTVAHVRIAASAFVSNYVTPYLMKGNTKVQALSEPYFLQMSGGDSITIDFPIRNLSSLDCGDYKVMMYFVSTVTMKLGGQSTSLSLYGCEQTALEETPAEHHSGVEKIIRNGQMFILRGGKTYLPDGRGL